MFMCITQKTPKALSGERFAFEVLSNYQQGNIFN